MIFLIPLQLYTDMIWGSCMDALLKEHMVYDEPVYMYVFSYRSEYEYLPFWMGKCIIIFQNLSTGVCGFSYVISTVLNPPCAI